jgi:hypothetical protein
MLLLRQQIFFFFEENGGKNGVASTGNCNCFDSSFGRLDREVDDCGEELRQGKRR